jgi:hypothetical protein
MNTKTMVIVGVAAVFAWLIVSRKSASAATIHSAPGANNSAMVAAGINAGSKIIGSLFGSGGSTTQGGKGVPTSSFVTSYDQIGAGSKVVGTGFVGSYDDS